MSPEAALLWLSTYLVGFPCSGVDSLQDALEKHGAPVQMNVASPSYHVFAWPGDLAWFVLHVRHDEEGYCVDWSKFPPR